MEAMALAVVGGLMLTQFAAIILVWRTVANLSTTTQLIQARQSDVHEWHQLTVQLQAKVNTHEAALDDFRKDVGTFRAEMTGVRDCKTCLEAIKVLMEKPK